MYMIPIEVTVLTPIVAPLLTPTEIQLERWRLKEKYENDVKHIDRLFWRTGYLGKMLPTITGSSTIGALNKHIPEFKKLRQRYKDKIQCIGIIFREEDVILEKRVVTQEDGKKTLSINEIVASGSKGTLIFEVEDEEIEKELREILNNKMIKIGAYKSRGYGRIKIGVS